MGVLVDFGVLDCHGCLMFCLYWCCDGSLLISCVQISYCMCSSTTALLLLFVRLSNLDRGVDGFLRKGMDGGSFSTDSYLRVSVYETKK